jgi:hypothetical protein
VLDPHELKRAAVDLRQRMLGEMPLQNFHSGAPSADWATLAEAIEQMAAAMADSQLFAIGICIVHRDRRARTCYRMPGARIFSREGLLRKTSYQKTQKGLVLSRSLRC